MTAIIQNVCIGMPKTIRHDGKDVVSGIFKTPVVDPVSINKNGIVGDGQADLTVHGGADKAVYAYPESHYATWAAELGVAGLEAAQFGENLTVSGIDEGCVTIGDRFRFGSVLAIASQPRLPCFKLGIRMNDETFPQTFLRSGRLGIYLRIEQEGSTAVGDTFTCVDRATHGVTVTELWRIVFSGDGLPDEADRCLDLLPHLDAGWQRRLRALARNKRA